MICLQCHGAVDEQAAACSRCGAVLLLPVQCAHCRAVNRPGSQFCDQCGQPLEPRSDPRADSLKSERKHVTVQEVVYNSLLKPDRRSIHERIARTLESLFHDRLDSVLDNLALHYSNSDCTDKAAEYLIRSGEKSLEKYAVEESHDYYASAYRLLNRIAAQTLEAVIATTEQFGYEYVVTSANAFYGIVSAALGNLGKGVAIIRERIQIHRQRGKRNHDLIFTHMLGRFYFSLVFRKGSLGLTALIKNAGFLMRTMPMASRLAEQYLREAIEIGMQIGTRLRLAQACLDLGLLYGHKKRFTDARAYIARSIDLFDRCGADVLLVETRAALDDLS